MNPFNDQRGYRERMRSQQEDRARLRSIYTRNTILIILSLGAAISVFLLTRFLATERVDPEAERLEKVLQEALPAASFTVTIDQSAQMPEIGIRAVVSKAPDDIDGFITRIEDTVYHESGYRQGFVAIRLFERLREGDANALASLAARRTSISEIGKSIE
jgi:hypothetical protein